MGVTNQVVDELNTTVTERLFSARWLVSDARIEIDGHVLFPGHPVVTHAADRILTFGLDAGEWVRNGDRWTVNAGTRDELYLTNLDNGHRQAIPADYIAAGNVTVGYASTINRAQVKRSMKPTSPSTTEPAQPSFTSASPEAHHANHVHTRGHF